MLSGDFLASLREDRWAGELNVDLDLGVVAIGLLEARVEARVDRRGVGASTNDVDAAMGATDASPPPAILPRLERGFRGAPLF